MLSETRTFEDLVVVTAVARFTPAERTGLVVGDLIVSFGLHAPSIALDDREMLQSLKRTDWLTILRGGVMFRLSCSEGLHGFEFEAAAPVELIVVPTGLNWNHYWGGVQLNGSMTLIPNNISPLWTLFPPFLYLRFRQYQMLTATLLVLCVSFLAGGMVVLIIAYVATAILPWLAGPDLLREAAIKQGYLARGSYAIASHSLAASLEIETANAIREQRKINNQPKHTNAEI